MQQQLLHQLMSLRVVLKTNQYYNQDCALYNYIGLGMLHINTKGDILSVLLLTIKK